MLVPWSPELRAHPCSAPPGAASSLQSNSLARVEETSEDQVPSRCGVWLSFLEADHFTFKSRNEENGGKSSSLLFTPPPFRFLREVNVKGKRGEMVPPVFVFLSLF